MSISALRTAVTNAGGSPTQYTHVGLLRQLITAWGGTPASFDIVNLLRQAITTKGGTPASFNQTTLLRQLITTLGGTPTSFRRDDLWTQLGTLGTSFPGSVDSSISIPTLAADHTIDPVVWQTQYPPTFDIGLDDTHAVGDTIWLEQANDNGFTTGIVRYPHTITGGEAAAHAATFSGLSDVLSGTHRYRAYVQHGSVRSPTPTSYVTHGPDDIGAVLTLPTHTSVTATTATIGCTTDTGEGPLWYVVVPAASEPTTTQIKAGQNSSGGAAVKFNGPSGTTMTSSGAKTVNLTGLTSNTAQYVYWYQEDALANPSNVLSDSFTTDAAAAFSMTHTDDPPTQNIGFAATTATFTGAAIGAADSSRKILVAVLQSSGGGATASVTVGGISATQRGSANQNLSLWEAAVPTGTTATIVVSAGASNISYCGITVVSIIGSTGSPTVHTPLAYGFNNSPQQIAVTTPTGGGTYVVAEVSILTGTSAFANATKTSQDSTVGETISTALRSTAGAATVSLSGHGNQNSCMSAISYS